jgi:hypothetical protein
MSSVTTSSRLRRSAAVLVAAGGLSVAAALPASAQPTNNQQGLINVNLQDVTAQVPVSVAANICGVPVSVLAQGVNPGPVVCTATGNATATRNPGGGNAQNTQNGLVNVNIQDVTVQIPVAVVANVCGVPVSILAANIATAPVTCTPTGTATAVR